MSKFVKQSLQDWHDNYQLHNIPFITIKQLKGKKSTISIISIYELQKSAANWSYAEFIKK